MTSSRFELPTTDRDALAEAIASVKFAAVRMRAGYNQDDVDRYLDELEQLVRHGASVAEIETSVSEALFNTTRIAIGYDVDDVDDFLDEVIAAALAIEPTPLDLLAAHYATEAIPPRPAPTFDYSAPAPPVPPLAEALAESAAPDPDKPMTRRQLRELRRREEEAKAAAEGNA